MADTPEKKVKKKVTEFLKSKGVYYFYPMSHGMGSSGVPDIVCCYKGQFIGIEVKADMRKNPPTALQRKNLADITRAGGTALVIDAFNLDTLFELLGGNA